MTHTELLESGRQRIAWARANMPIVRALGEQFAHSRPFAGLTLGICLHVEAKTGVWLEALTRGGAEVVITGSPGTTQDDTVVAIEQDYGVRVLGHRHESFEDHIEQCREVLRAGPDLISDNGADLHSLLFTEPEFASLRSQLRGATEETTTGANRLRKLAPSQNFATLVINDTQAKRIVENRYGVGSSVVDGIMRATNVMLHGKRALVIGYGYCGSGVAMRLRGMGAHVTVVEQDPLIRLEAHMEGFPTAELEQALPQAELIVTVTGCDGVLNRHHFDQLREGVIIANAGHFAREIELDYLRAEAESVTVMRQQVEAIRFRGRDLYLLSRGNLINLAAGDGNPIEIMDLGLALQALSLAAQAQGTFDGPKVVQPVPSAIERQVAQLAVDHWIGKGLL
ncbi:adenosylhomocysteinase [Ferrimonas sp. SCSIO 43195]|uniref:adenosylhomocysteinase n=1 Tax=Ferrimonas sp. SCSIO 43195 TaxID=2822844 RepID=UPI002075CC85|nr:adenosylhomocysteinase [Ferrimonas sp. SCSIO 43195]USD37768.1 adenosylhomocysteinase [Ferrimonas sp. SCSIO 43195]